MLALSPMPETFDEHLNVVARYAAEALNSEATDEDTRLALMTFAEAEIEPAAHATLRYCMAADDDALLRFVEVEPTWASVELSLRRCDARGEPREQHLVHLWTNLSEDRAKIRQAWIDAGDR